MKEQLDLLKAMASIQERVTKLPMDGFNPHFRSQFTTLGTVIDTLKPIMSEEGVLCLQPPIGSNAEAGVDNIFIHLETGQMLSFPITIPINGTNIGQEAGKAITYLRRYALASIFMLYSDEDIDANNPDQQEIKGHKGTDTPKKKKKDEPDLATLISDYWAPLTAVANELGIKYDPLPDDITQGRFGELFLALQEKVENAQEEE